MKNNGQAPTGKLDIKATVAKAREHGKKIEFIRRMAKVLLGDVIKNAKAAQACIDAHNITAADECLEQVMLRASAARNNVKQLADFLK